MNLPFTLLHRDGAARAGRVVTPHGPVETPVFMPVGTQATVKGLTPAQLADAGARIVIGQHYHLALRSGPAEPPVFMPCGTQATVKFLTPAQLADAGARIVLGNTYHLALRPGDALVA